MIVEPILSPSALIGGPDGLCNEGVAVRDVVAGQLDGQQARTACKGIRSGERVVVVFVVVVIVVLVYVMSHQHHGLRLLSCMFVCATIEAKELKIGRRKLKQEGNDGGGTGVMLSAVPVSKAERLLPTLATPHVFVRRDYSCRRQSQDDSRG